MRLMIVDSSNLMRGRIARVAAGNPELPFLKIVALARDGMEALEQCRRLLPEIVTLDLGMTKMDAETCIEGLVSINPEVLILIASDLHDKAAALRALQKGAHGYIQKPFSDAQLVAALRELLKTPA